jgi:hypothetical protein
MKHDGPPSAAGNVALTALNESFHSGKDAGQNPPG